MRSRHPTSSGPTTSLADPTRAARPRLGPAARPEAFRGAAQGVDEASVLVAAGASGPRWHLSPRGHRDRASPCEARALRLLAVHRESRLRALPVGAGPDGGAVHGFRFLMFLRCWVGVFAVTRKHDMLRLVFDCRPANQLHRQPPSTSPATPGACATLGLSDE